MPGHSNYMDYEGYWYLGRYNGGAGRTLQIEIIGGGGYNGNPTEHDKATINIRNGNDVGTNISCTYYRTGRPDHIKDVVVSSESTGNISSATNWDVYVDMSAFSGKPIINTLCGLEASFNKTMTIVGTSVTTTNGSTVIGGKEEYVINSECILLNNSNTIGNIYTTGGNVIIDGDLNVTGSIEIGGQVIVPTITFSNNSNCTLSTYYNNKGLVTGNEILLSFTVEITPDNASQNCQIEFSLPNRTSNMTKRGECIANCTGWTDDSNLISIYNCLSTGIVGSNRAIIKFQSVSTNIHYISIICRYTSD